jgi:hypothetical protein
MQINSPGLICRSNQSAGVYVSRQTSTRGHSSVVLHKIMIEEKKKHIKAMAHSLSKKQEAGHSVLLPVCDTPSWQDYWAHH